MSFVHLHNHTMHSALDGLSKVAAMVDAVVADSQPAVAMTDHGTLEGVWELVTECRKKGVKPIVGIEAYLAIADHTRDERSRFDPKTIEVPASDDFDGSDATDDGETRKKSYEHLTMLVKNHAGWKNLVAMLNDAEKHSFKRKPLLDWAQMREHSEGLIVGTGCLGGPVAGNLLRGDKAAAERELLTLVDIFGKENVFVEVMYHGIPAEDAVIAPLVELANKHDLLIVATNDCHYTDADDADIHDMWLCVSQKRGTKTVTVDDEKRFKFNGSGYHMRTAEEMHAIFDHIPGCENAVSNSLLIADMIDDDVIGETHVRLPKFRVDNLVWTPTTDIKPLGGVTVREDGSWAFDTNYDAFYSMVRDGAARLYGVPFTSDLKERLRHEVDVISSKGFVDYFLIVWDYVEWATSDRGMPTPEFPRGEPGQKRPIVVGVGRGSAPGSVVAYCMGITGIDPIKYGLLFERFLDATRLDLPDIDSDFEGERRDEVIKYLEARWGADSVALLGTWNMDWAKSAIRDIGRVTNRSKLANDLASVMVTAAMAEDSPFEKLLDPNEEEHGVNNHALQAFYRDDAEAAQLIDDARAIEGVVSGASIHACGTVIGDVPLDTLIPLRWNRSKKSPDHWVTQWDADGVGETGFGLIKFDILSIRTLDIIGKALRMIERDTSEVIDYNHLSFDDERSAKVWQMLGEGRTSGVFQLASGGMTELCMAVGVKSFADLMALVALYRPGPMAAGMHHTYARRNRGVERVSYVNFSTSADEQAVIARVLDSTHGAITYQEQLMSLAREVADFSDKEVNLLRKAFSKKNKPLMDSLRERWNEGGAASYRRDWTDHGKDWTKNADGTPWAKEAKLGFKQSTLDELWRTFEGSAAYLFNASHSAAYGYTAYLTAWLKANFPAHFGAALLGTVPRNSTEKRRKALQDLAHDGIEVFGPDVNTGDVDTSVDSDGKVRIGMGEVSGVAGNAQWIVAERERGGPFKDFADLCARVKLPATEGSLALTKKLPSTAIEGLIESGALDSFGPRLGMMMVVRSPNTRIPNAEWGDVERAARQRGRINTHLGTSPLLSKREQLADWREPGGRGSKPQPLQKIPMASGSSVVTLGVVAAVSKKEVRTGTMLFVTLEGSNRSVEVKVFPSTFAGLEFIPEVGQVVGVTGCTSVADIPGEDDEAGEDDLVRLEINAYSLWQGPLEDDPTGLTFVVDAPIPAGEPVIEPPVLTPAGEHFHIAWRQGMTFSAGVKHPESRRNLKAVFPDIDKWVGSNCDRVGASMEFDAKGHPLKLTVEISDTGQDLAAVAKTSQLMVMLNTLVKD